MSGERITVYECPVCHMCSPTPDLCPIHSVQMIEFPPESKTKPGADKPLQGMPDNSTDPMFKVGPQLLPLGGMDSDSDPLNVPLPELHIQGMSIKIQWDELPTSPGHPSEWHSNLNAHPGFRAGVIRRRGYWYYWVDLLSVDKAGKPISWMDKCPYKSAKAAKDKAQHWVNNPGDFEEWINLYTKYK